jgi:hypothetical protein
MRFKLIIPAILAFALLSPFGIAQQKTSMSGEKKTMPMRDSKGRFVKKTEAAKGKEMPMRDSKGRFVKKTEAAKGKEMPLRDSKGRFIKKTDAKKSGPARDPKTGRFIKKN